MANKSRKRKRQTQPALLPPPSKKPKVNTEISEGIATDPEKSLDPEEPNAFLSPTSLSEATPKASKGRHEIIDLERDSSAEETSLTQQDSQSPSPNAANSTPSHNPVPPSVLSQRCPVCYEEEHQVDYPRDLDVPDSCKHALLICSSCITATLSIHMSTRGFDRIGCPECNEPWEYAYIQKHATTDVFKNYENQMTMRFLENDASFRRCLAPRCDSSQLHDEDSGPIVNCQACKFKTCFTHRVPWHTGHTCEEYEREIETPEESKNRTAREERETRKIARPCPRCKVSIEKTTGCDHMICTNCGHQFCWACLADHLVIVDSDNRQHLGTCPHWQ